MPPTHNPVRPARIISGGQTGADRAALDFAIAAGIPHGGWCPRGRRATDGPIPARYHLRETESAGYLSRTKQNVRDADATVVFTLAPAATGGSAKTLAFAVRVGKPCLHLTPDDPAPATRLRAFLARHGVRCLNVAGSREEKEPGLARWVQQTLAAAFGPCPPPARRPG
jgi:hypothetical protein